MLNAGFLFHMKSSQNIKMKTNKNKKVKLQLDDKCFHDLTLMVPNDRTCVVSVIPGLTNFSGTH